MIIKKHQTTDRWTAFQRLRDGSRFVAEAESRADARRYLIEMFADRLLTAKIEMMADRLETHH